MILFLALVHRYEKWSNHSKALPGGGVEIGNVTFCIFNIFNFNSATMWRFTTLTSLFPSFNKSIIQIFDTSWPTRNIRQNVKN